MSSAPPSIPVTFTPTLKLGAGGMAEVHLAKMSGPSGETWVALKRIRAELEGEPELRQRFEREARIGARLRHPHVVALVAWGVDARGPYIAFEYLVGRSAGALVMAQMRSGSALPLEVALCIGRDAAAALAYAHGFEDAELGAGGVIHRDVSLDNVLVGYDGAAKLTDFGIARLAGRETRLTRVQTLKGKVGYLAPELFDGHPGDVRSDVFAFGVTLYKLVCGVPPFHGQTDAELMRAVFVQQPLAPSRVRADVPAELDTLLLRCLAQEREQRPASMDEVLRVVEGAIGVPLESARERLRARMVELFPMHEDPLLRTTRSGPANRPKTATVGVAAGAARGHWSRRQTVGALVAAATAAAGVVGVLRWRAGEGDAAPGPGVAAEGGQADVGARPGTGVASGPRPGAEPDAGLAAARAEVEGASGGARAASDGAGREEAARAASAGARPDAGVSAKRSRTRASSRASSEARGKPRGGGRSAPAGRGTLVVRVRPWAQVFVDGDLVGTTPLAPLPLAPGPHSVIVVNPEKNLRRHFTVQLEPGETRRLDVTLEPAAPR